MTVVLGGLSAAFPVRADEPPEKLSQIAAAYQDSPKDLLSCAVCTFFIRPRGCNLDGIFGALANARLQGGGR